MMGHSTQNSKIIKASREVLYQAFADPSALARWMAPGDMTARIHHFDWRVGGGYTMSLFYPSPEKEMRGKTSGNEDKYAARIVELRPFEKIVLAISFDSTDPVFSGEMIMEVTLEQAEDGTKVTFSFHNIPVGIKPADNEAGTMATLQKLANYVE